MYRSQKQSMREHKQLRSSPSPAEALPASAFVPLCLQKHNHHKHNRGTTSKALGRRRERQSCVCVVGVVWVLCAACVVCGELGVRVHVCCQCAVCVYCVQWVMRVLCCVCALCVHCVCVCARLSSVSGRRPFRMWMEPRVGSMRKRQWQHRNEHGSVLSGKHAARHTKP